MEITETRLEGVKCVRLAVHGDARGWFLESFQAARYAQHLTGKAVFVQDNSSYSSARVVRGLHYQLRRPQGKLVRVLHGEILDVTVDVRRGSSQFGQSQSVRLSASGFCQLWVPPGYAHGFAVVGDEALVEYKCTDVYVPGDEVCLRWDDPALNIDWGVLDPVVSDKDRGGLSLAELVAQNKVF